MLVLAAVALLASPITISAPVTLVQAAIVLTGLLAATALTWLGIRRVFAPLERITEQMERVDLLAPRRDLSPQASGIAGHVSRAFERMVERLEAERRDSGRRALEAQEGERRRIARDLHDEVGQLLTGVLFELDAVREAVAPARRGEIGETSASVRRALDEVRRICRELRPEMLEELGLVSALTELSRSFAQLSGIAVDRDLAPRVPELAPGVDIAIYRIVQESLTNVARHARAGRVGVSLRAGEAGVVVRVADDGEGRLPGAWQLHGGILGMRERAALIGATLYIAPRPGGGTEVRLEVPAGPHR